MAKVSFTIQDCVTVERRNTLIEEITTWTEVSGAFLLPSGNRGYAQLKDDCYADAVGARLQHLPEVALAYKPTPPSYFP